MWLGLGEAEQKKLRHVRVRILEIEWVNLNIRDLFLYLAHVQDVEIFDNELVKVLLMKQDYSY